MVKQTTIALVDCDCFFVSCERKRNPSLKGKPVCVLSNLKGCVISRSEEAKLMGVRMGEPYFMLEKEHPKVISIVADHDYYIEVSHQVMAVVKNFSPYVEVYSIDEAFVDFTGLTRLYDKEYYELAQYLRQKILDDVDIPVSIGVSLTKTLAKLASDKSKNMNSHVFMIRACDIIAVLEKTSIDEIWGIGRNITQKLKRNGILVAAEFVAKSDSWLDKLIGINGIELRHELLGEMTSAVSNDKHIPKSIQNSQAFGIFTSDFNFIKSELNRHIHSSCVKLRRCDTKCMRVGVMLRTKDFKVFYAKQDLKNPTNFEMEISKTAIELLKTIYNPNILYRSTGINLDKIGARGVEQLSLYADEYQNSKKDKLGACFDNLERKIGRNAVTIGYKVK